jgi:hypothetical protein
MDAVTLAAANASAKKRYGTGGKALQVVASRNNVMYQGQSNGTDTPRTYRSQHVALANITSLTLRYGNFYGTANGAVGDGTTDLVIACSVEIGGDSGNSGKIIRGYVGGSRQVTIKPGGMADFTIPVAIAKGTAFYVRTAVISGTYGIGIFGNWAAGRGGVDNVGTGASNSGEGDNGSAGGDQTATGLPTANVFDKMFSPFALLGTTSDGALPCVALIGDSILNGYSDMDDYGFGRRAAAGIPHINLAHPGELARQFAVNGTSFTLVEQRYQMLRFGTDAICNYGTNDINAGRNVAALQGDLVTIWNMLKGFGLRTRQTTIVPKTTSTDGWTTTTNQTKVNSTYDGYRVTVNQWLRDGAPLVGGAPAAVGTSGAARCAVLSSTGTLTPASGPAHPLAMVIDTATLLESAQDSGLHSVAAVRSVPDITGTAGQLTWTSAGGNFQAGDVGKGLYVPGADTSGGNLVTFISKVVSATQVITTGKCQTAGTFAGKVGAMTVDGLHPVMDWHVRAAALVAQVPFTL